MARHASHPLRTPTRPMRGLVRAIPAASAVWTSDEALSGRLRTFLTTLLAAFPWRVEFEDWTGVRYAVGGSAPHWSGHASLDVRLNRRAARDLLALDIMRFLERFLEQEVDLSGNLYLLAELRNYAKLSLTPWQILQNRLRNFVFENPSRAKTSVKSHYDIADEALFYLDQVYRSYSCAMFEEPWTLARQADVEPGAGEADTFDSLEKAQWRKFAHAADYLAPAPGETVLDVGCGYPGFLRVLLHRHQPSKVVGWTHSANQVRDGARMMAGRDPSRYELNEGDYREDTRVYDHVHSTGMISHVGPPGPESGLVNYVREVRRRIRTGGRYVHHALMMAYTGRPLFDQIGAAFNRRYVWPGFYWYTLGQHVTALEQHGFQVMHVIDMTPHYAKTTWVWHERLCREKARFVGHTSEATCRAWQVFLAGITGSFLNRQSHCYRLLCQAVDTERPSPGFSDPARGISARLPIAFPRGNASDREEHARSSKTGGRIDDR